MANDVAASEQAVRPSLKAIRTSLRATHTSLRALLVKMQTSLCPKRASSALDHRLPSDLFAQQAPEIALPCEMQRTLPALYTSLFADIALLPREQALLYR